MSEGNERLTPEYLQEHPIPEITGFDEWVRALREMWDNAMEWLSDPANGPVDELHVGEVHIRPVIGKGCIYICLIATDPRVPEPLAKRPGCIHIPTK